MVGSSDTEERLGRYGRILGGTGVNGRPVDVELNAFVVLDSNVGEQLQAL